MNATDLDSRTDYDLPPAHPFYEETDADEPMIAVSVAIVLAGLLLVCL